MEEEDGEMMMMTEGIQGGSRLNHGKNLADLF